MKHLLKTTILEPLMAYHLVMVIMNANTTHQKMLPKTYTPLIIHYHYFVSQLSQYQCKLGLHS